jgi:hypothetical protein
MKIKNYRCSTSSRVPELVTAGPADSSFRLAVVLAARLALRV